MRLQDFVFRHPINRARPAGITAAKMNDIARHFSTTTGKLAAHEAAFRFYLANEAVARAPNVDATEELTSLWRSATVDVVKGVVYYLWLVCLREMRHGSSAMCRTAFGKNTDKYTDAQKAVEFICYTGDPHLIRFEFPDLGAADLASAIRDHYYKGGWKGAYGGKAWGGIADVLVAYLNGEMSAAMATDRAWTLQHNTTSVFNKSIIYTLDNARLQNVLNAQAKDSVLSRLNSVSAQNVASALELAKALGVSEKPSHQSGETAPAEPARVMCGLKFIEGDIPS